MNSVRRWLALLAGLLLASCAGIEIAAQYDWKRVVIDGFNFIKNQCSRFFARHCAHVIEMCI